MKLYLYRDLNSFMKKGYLIDENQLLKDLELLRQNINKNIDIINLNRVNQQKTIELANYIKNGSTDFLIDDETLRIKYITENDLGIMYSENSMVKTINYIIDSVNKRVEKNISDDLCVVLLSYKNALVDLLDNFGRIYAFKNKYKYASNDGSLEITDIVVAKNILDEYEKDIKLLLSEMVVPLILTIKDKNNKKTQLEKEIKNFIDLSLK